MAKSMKKIIVFGSLNMDLSIECDHMLQIGETAMGSGFVTSPGGKGANQAVACAKLGGAVNMIGAVGSDLHGKEMLKSLVNNGVECSEIRAVDGVPTGIAMITRVGGDNFIIVDSGANYELNIDSVSKAIDKVGCERDFFLCQLECDIKTTWEAIKYAKTKGLITVLNPAPAKAIPASVLSCVDMLIVNETECEIVSKIYPETLDDGRHAAEALQRSGVKIVVITLGERGSFVFSDGDAIVSVPPSTDAVDTTCAGDTYIGALLASLSHGKTLGEAVDLATHASALATTRVGAQQSIPTLSELN